MNLRMNEYGFLLCPVLPECDGELYLDLGAAVGLCADTKQEDLTYENAVTTGWEVVCTEGHKLASGESEHGPAEFDLAAFISAWGGLAPLLPEED